MAVEQQQPALNGTLDAPSAPGPGSKRAIFIVRLPRPAFAGEAALQERQENFNRLLAKVKAFRGDSSQGPRASPQQEGSKAGAGHHQGSSNGVVKQHNAKDERQATRDALRVRARMCVCLEPAAATRREHA